MAKAVQFGAGNIGRGFVGQLLSESGFETVYVDVDETVISELNRRGWYPLRLVDSDGNVQDLKIGPVRAVSGRDKDAVVEELANADFAGTSVGLKALPHVAEAIAAGVTERRKRNAPPINVLLCENQWHAAQMVRGYMAPHLDSHAAAYAESHLGLIETVVARMVPALTAELKAEDPLLIRTEPYKELPVAASMAVGTFPTIVGVELAENFDGYEARKLFLHNASHAALAYLGYPKHEFIWQAASDPECYSICEAVLDESTRAVGGEYGFPEADLKAFADDLLYRYKNRVVGDPVARVGADPLRKLRPSDRLIGAAQLCVKRGIVPQALAVVIAAALRYDNPSDPSAVEMQGRLKAEGIDYFLQDYCAVATGSELHRLIVEELA